MLQSASVTLVACTVCVWGVAVASFAAAISAVVKRASDSETMHAVTRAVAANMRPDAVPEVPLPKAWAVLYDAQSGTVVHDGAKKLGAVGEQAPLLSFLDKARTSEVEIHATCPFTNEICRRHVVGTPVVVDGKKYVLAVQRSKK